MKSNQESRKECCISTNQLQRIVDRVMEKDQQLTQLKEITGIYPSVFLIEPEARSVYHIQQHAIYVNPYIDPDEDSIREALIHEYIHAYDHLIKGIDLSTPTGLAKSEVHAVKAAETSNLWLYKREITKKIAIKALSIAISNKGDAQQIIEQVFDQVYSEDSFPTQPRPDEPDDLSFYNDPYD